MTGLLESDATSTAHHANVKPFTVTPPVATKQGLALLISTLDQQATDHLVEGVARTVQATPSVRLGDLEAEVGTQPLDLVETISYQELRESASSAPSLELEFRSPTVFRSGRHEQTPFPVPKLVFGHFRARWNAFAPEALACDLAFDDLGLRVAEFEGRGVPFVDGHRRAGRLAEITFTGFVGKATFEAASPGARPPALRWLHTLARFAAFCGTGANTTIGMGATRYRQAEAGTGRGQT